MKVTPALRYPSSTSKSSISFLLSTIGKQKSLVEKNKTVAAYARSDLFERRRKLMAEWADYLAGRGT